MKHCSHNGCRRVAVIAERVSDFWVTKCEEHRAGLTLGADSMNRLQKVHGGKRAAA
ncbi:MAG: hypothetical protein JWO19_4385 [Bryobacterales bacterium]|nr:hypothetical protein [Bryobacterales bacterium]